MVECFQENRGNDSTCAGQQLAVKKVFLGKASKDTRYDNEQVVTHNMDRMDSIPISSVDDLYQAVGDADVIGIDEVQFFTEEFIEAFEN